MTVEKTWTKMTIVTRPAAEVMTSVLGDCLALRLRQCPEILLRPLELSRHYPVTPQTTQGYLVRDRLDQRDAGPGGMAE